MKWKWKQLTTLVDSQEVVEVSHAHHIDRTSMTSNVKCTSSSSCMKIAGESYFGTPLVQLVTARAWWLISLLMLQSLSSIILTHFSALIERHLVIAVSLGTRSLDDLTTHQTNFTSSSPPLGKYMYSYF